MNECILNKYYRQIGLFDSWTHVFISIRFFAFASKQASSNQPEAGLTGNFFLLRFVWAVLKARHRQTDRQIYHYYVCLSKKNCIIVVLRIFNGSHHSACVWK